MMITITNSGIYKSEFSITEMRFPEDMQLIPDDEVIKYSSEEVQLGESVTFERLFEIIHDNIISMNEIFQSCLGGYSIKPFLEELKDIPTKKTELESLEFHWFGEKSDNDVSFMSGLHGIGEYDGETCSYAVEFTPLNNLKYLNVKLNTKLSLINFNDSDNFKLDIGNKNFTVYDLFYGILYEISWNGDPSGRSDRLSELEDSIETSQKQIDDGDAYNVNDLGTFFSELESRDKYLVKYKDLRDRVNEDLSQNVDDIIPLKNCLTQKLKLYHEIMNRDNLKGYSKKISDVEFNLQLLYGLEEDDKYHRFWETPKCSCPKIDNIVKYPNGKYIKDKSCPIHGKL